MVKIWVTTDLHLGHAKLAEDGLRPVDFSEKIMTNLHRMINPSDVLICLGDICFTEDEMWHERLSHVDCKRWLIRGNHDKKSLTYYLEHGWHWVGDSMSLQAFGKNILFSHKPVRVDGYDLNIHGHFHDFGLDRVKETEPELHALLTKKHVLVCLEKLQYSPVKLQRLVELN